MNSDVSSILSIPKMTLEQKLAVKKLGKPMPVLNISQEYKYKNRFAKRSFHQEIYCKHEWICGCEKTNAFYCFPCLLFGRHVTYKSNDCWIRTGFSDLKHLSQKIKIHANSSWHIDSCFKFALLGNVDIATQLNSQYRSSVVIHNEQVKKNKDTLCKVISFVRFCDILDEVLKDSPACQTSLNIGIFPSFHGLAAELDKLLKENSTNTVVFKDSPKVILNEIFECMSAVCQEEIQHQIDASDFIVVQCDEITSVSNQYQVALILRYIYNGSLYERFWNFFNPSDRTVNNVADSIIKEVQPLLKTSVEKFIAQSNDVGIVNGDCSSVQAKISEIYPFAHFVHCYAHHLSLIIENETCLNSRVRFFFSTLAAIPTLFSNFLNQSGLLKEVIEAALPGVDLAAFWNNNMCAVSVVFKYHSKLVECLATIEEKCTDRKAISEASGLHRALKDEDFLFWLSFFHLIFPHTETLFHKFLSAGKNFSDLQTFVNIFEKALWKVCKSMSSNELEESDSEVIEPHQKRQKSEVAEHDKPHSIKEIRDAIMNQMNGRFSCRKYLEAVSLVRSDLFSEYNACFPENALSLTVDLYPALDKNRLRVELKFLYSKKGFRHMKGIMPLFGLIINNDLMGIFDETLKLLKIVITTPMFTGELERCFETSKNTKTFLKNMNSECNLQALAMVSINKSLIGDIKHFDEKVMEKFISLNHRKIDFTFIK